MSDDKPTTYGLLQNLTVKVEDGFKEVNGRLGALERDSAKRKGRDGVINKIIMVVIGLLSAVFGAKYGGK
jgi:hypothetical protein